VLKPAIHNQLIATTSNAPDDENMARAFAVAIELVRHTGRMARNFTTTHELTDLLSYTIGAAPGLLS